MAAAELPVELLSQIARYTSHGQGGDSPAKLGPYALVNKTWQYVFEAEIYSTVWLRSPRENIENITARTGTSPLQRGLTFHQLEEITSGPQDWRKARRDAIRHIRCLVSVPHWLGDELRERNDEHSQEHSLRRENDEVFTHNLLQIFHHLSTLPSWMTPARPLTLTFVLQAEHIYPSSTHTSLFVGEFDDPMSSYRASFLPSDPPLPVLSSIRSIAFPETRLPSHGGRQHGLSLSAQSRIISACAGSPSLTSVTLDGAYYVPFEDTTTFTLRRRELTQALPLLPPSLRILTIKWYALDPPTEFGRPYFPDPPPNSTYTLSSVPSIPSDPLSSALKLASLNLTRLYIHELEFTPAIFDLSPSSSREVRWPNLEIFSATSIPLIFSPSIPLLVGSPSPAASRLSHPLDPRVEYPPNEEEDYMIVAPYFDEVFAGAGRAAEKAMPRLRKMTISYAEFDLATHEMVYEAGADGGRGMVRFESGFGYSPTRGVLGAWGVREGGMVLRGMKLEGEVDWAGG